jgi:tRNA threonylcarbamoyladenosine biosynthesis protein TsaE
MNITYELKNINEVAEKLLPLWLQHKVMALYAGMGSGKTTLTAALVKLLSTDHVESPTYSIINQYSTANGNIYHMDLYRLKNTDDAINAGVEDALYSNNLCIVEWPEIAEDLLPENTLKVHIKINELHQRVITI